jgi:hypothetical protein
MIEQEKIPKKKYISLHKNEILYDGNNKHDAYQAGRKKYTHIQR